MTDSQDTNKLIVELIEKALDGDRVALAELFENHRKRLHRMVELRLDRRLKGRVDVSDVLQEAFIDLAAKLDSFRERDASMSFFLWLRMVTGERLLNIHRRHLDAEKRDVRRDVSINQCGIPEAPSRSLAAKLIGQFTSAGHKAIRVELQMKLSEILMGMESVDREIIALRHFEELTNKEVAVILGLSKTAASNRYVRAIKKLKTAMDSVSDFDSFLEQS